MVKKKKLKFARDVLVSVKNNQLVTFPFFIATLVLVMFHFILETPFSPDNARYAYSAIFQGFAAILAISLTIILITLQNIHNQSFSIEERIYKIVGERLPTYIPKSIRTLESFVRDGGFMSRLSMYLANPNLQSTTNEEGFPFGSKIPNPGQVAESINNELIRKFNFLNQQKINEKRLKRLFKFSLGVNVIVLVYTMTSLVVAIPDTGVTDIILFQPADALFIGLYLALIALGLTTQFFLLIVQIWKLESE